MQAHMNQLRTHTAPKHLHMHNLHRLSHTQAASAWPSACPMPHTPPQPPAQQPALFPAPTSSCTMHHHLPQAAAPPPPTHHAALPGSPLTQPAIPPCRFYVPADKAGEFEATWRAREQVMRQHAGFQGMSIMAVGDTYTVSSRWGTGAGLAGQAALAAWLLLSTASAFAPT